MTARATPAHVRIMRRVEVSPAGCWIFTGRLNDKGYCRTGERVDGRLRYVYGHRVMYEHARGPIPAGLTLDHLCRVRACVNPAHLEPVTLTENVMRGEGVMARHARRTHCPRCGDPYTALDITRQRSNRRRACRPCDLLNDHENYVRRRDRPAYIR